MDVHRSVAELPDSTPSQRSAGALHDVVEDGDITGVLMSDIERWFPVEVSSKVKWLTDPEFEGTRAERKEQARAHSAQAPADVQDIKLCDIKSNCSNVAETNPQFALVYLPEKHDQVQRLVLGNAALRKELLTFIEGKMDDLGISYTLCDWPSRKEAPRF